MVVSSAVYVGRVRHRRVSPVRHAFAMPLHLVYLDLDEVEGLFRRRLLWSVGGPNLAWFRRKDYLGPRGKPLAEAVRDRVEGELGRRPSGAVRVLTQPRYFGCGFNPVSFYYCFEGERLDAIVAEITNTPWRERHAYVLDARAAREGGKPGGLLRFRFRKCFYVSPFMEMEIEYDWSFSEPGEGVFVHMNCRPEGGTTEGAGEGTGDDGAGDASGQVRPPKRFDATLTLARRELTGRRMAWILARYPFQTARVVGRIYFEALRLRLKQAPAYRHDPGGLRQEGPA